MKKMNKFRFGSSDSIDNDMTYVFESMPPIRECKIFCDGKEENRIWSMKTLYL